jgi:predicted NUDIX family NTP pyrophosphohydrolase
MSGMAVSFRVMLDSHLGLGLVTARPPTIPAKLQAHRSRALPVRLPGMATRRSAGIVLFRRPVTRADAGPESTPPSPEFEVLLGHPGGPFFKRRDEGHWTIPKGEPDDPADDLLAVARREFEEEVGHPPPDGAAADPIPLGTIVQKGGKVVHAWAIEGDVDPALAASNTFVMEWPPRSGRQEEFSEIDQVAWFTPDEARRRLKATQVPFVDRLAAILGGTAPAVRSDDDRLD